MAAQQTKDASFKDLNCAAVTVPADRIAFYATLRTEQLSLVNRLVADRTAGYALELSENDVATLAALAEEMAHAAKHLVSSLLDAELREGGA